MAGFSRRWAALVAWLALSLTLLAGAAAAQSLAPDYEAWESVAVRAEEAVETGGASTFAFERLRAELAGWRDDFLDAQAINAARIDTVESQLAALGEPPGEDEPAEEPRIAERRRALQAQLGELRAPVQLAQEAHTRATGLIGEIDATVRARQARSLGAQGPLPLNPANWPEAAGAVQDGVTELVAEVSTGLDSDARRQTLRRELPAILVFLLLAFVLLARGQIWVRRLARRVSRPGTRKASVLSFFVSLGLIAVPFAGLLALFAAATATTLTGLRGDAVLAALPLGGLVVLLAHWLAERYFPDGEGRTGPLDLAEATRRQAHWLTTLLGWIVGLTLIGRNFLLVNDTSTAAYAVLMFPVAVALGLILFQFGRLLAGAAQAEGEEPGTTQFRGRIVVVLGRLVTIVGVVGPLLAAFGFDTAAWELLRSTAYSLAVLGLVVLLQRLVFDIYVLIVGSETAADSALLPVLLALGLILVALPLLALIWGARVADLTEIWTRFRTGFSIGDSRLSPTTILTLLLVFTIGYMATRAVQGALRSMILPRTRLDAGGQDAAVSGIGYVGIIVAALVAITSAGIDLSNLALIAGALTVGISFGLQNIVSNFVSGIILLIERPISQGDWIQVGDEMGYVRDISIRSTRIETFDRTDVIVPNSDLVSGKVTNWTRGNSVGRIILPIGVAYGTDTQKVSDVLLNIARAHPMVLHNPEPYVLFHGFGDNSMNFEIRAILRDVNWILSVQTEMNHAIAKRFAEEGIEIPFPQRDLWVRNPEALRGGGETGGRSTQGQSGDWQAALKGERPDVIRGEEG
ncbi:DUF3772 domain-containing protein [Oceanicola granulosus]|nr:DUF3772 domain-containing protein [Oceanicola granulosus]